MMSRLSKIIFAIALALATLSVFQAAKADMSSRGKILIRVGDTVYSSEAFLDSMLKNTPLSRDGVNFEMAYNYGVQQDMNAEAQACFTGSSQDAIRALEGLLSFDENERPSIASIVYDSRQDTITAKARNTRAADRHLEIYQKLAIPRCLMM